MSLEDPPGMRPLASVSLTHVQYDDSDPLGMFMAYASLAPIAIIISYVTLIFFRRDLATILMFVGQLVNEGVNFVAKKIVRQARPTEYLGKGYGMPSSHSQFVAYFAFYITIYAFTRFTFQSRAWKPLITIAAMSMAGLVAYSRIHLTYHTPPQVLVGLTCGALFAGLWFAFCNWVLAPAIDLDSSVARWLLLRDTRDVPNVLVFEYETYRQYHAQKEKTS
ncbi:phosphatidic acid phosphatase type 2/haloperoxidase [Fimicolochytrium jonesii]|uniref:phosphatidic acid phosphatase type 2/haloperoxidase n=1 Tax=Fimicolochytrium jonesii TaxID=1396493 RepID=UPI0022FF311D|nr:phosphatidic acid phosphatase type 2/haloperoxidase [Fimicolochytrium jonesii]KAI8822687.1 phosphatidic acid phosphatase type 2/haloperoxidase [Fimicolochytrium jonesii]